DLRLNASSLLCATLLTLAFATFAPFGFRFRGRTTLCCAKHSTALVLLSGLSSCRTRRFVQTLRCDLKSPFQPMESGAIRQRADVHNLEVVQAFPEVLETCGVSIHHLRLMTAAAEILLHHFTSSFSDESCSRESNASCGIPE